ncbi:MAG: Gfo/Idh/MocA family oxidoreductase [Solirubrobacterales bacterium]
MRQARDRPLHAIVVGHGYAARAFHLPALRRLQSDRLVADRIGIVEPIAAVGLGPPAGAMLARDLQELVGAFPVEHTVVHVCSPPNTHANVIRRCAGMGFRRIIVEKPLVTTQADLDDIRQLATAEDMDLLVVANWLASRLTDTVVDCLLAGSHSRVEQITLRSSKSRVGKSLSTSAHTTAFAIEMPHLMALALHLSGMGMSVGYARSGDLEVDGRRVKMMGAAEMLLHSAHGYDVHLLTNLCSPRRERSVFVRWRDGTRLIGHYPCDSADLYSQMSIIDADGRVLDHRMFEDDTVQTFMAQAYAYFAGGGRMPCSDLTIHAKAIELLLEARDSAAGGASLARRMEAVQ